MALGADDGPGAHGHGGDQRGVRSDEGAFADHGLRFEMAVVIAGDGPGADVGPGADDAVADVGQMIDLHARGQVGGLDLDEVADPHALAQVGAGPQAGERADHGALGDGRALEMAEGADFHIVADPHAGREDHVGADRHVPAQYRVPGKIDRQRIGQGGAVFHGAGAKAVLRDGFGFGQLDPGIHAQDFVRIADDHGGGGPVGAGDGDHVGQIIFALGIVVADAVQPIEGAGAVDHHHARIAEPDGKLFRRRVAGFDDLFQAAVGAQDQAAVGSGVIRLEPQDDDARLRRGLTRGQHGVDGLGGDQRRVAV